MGHKDKRQFFFPPHSSAVKYVPFQEMYDTFTHWEAESVLVCRNQHPKKENFEMGRGGKEEFSINATECQSRQSIPNQLLLQNYCLCFL